MYTGCPKKNQTLCEHLKNFGTTDLILVSKDVDTFRGCFDVSHMFVGHKLFPQWLSKVTYRVLPFYNFLLACCISAIFHHICQITFQPFISCRFWHYYSHFVIPMGDLCTRCKLWLGTDFASQMHENPR